MLKPMDIHNKEFKKSMRGYDAEEVDEFLDEIIVDFEKMQREIEILKKQVDNYNENISTYREKEISLNNALVSVQRFADQMKKDAEDKASEIIADAQAEAEKIIGDTEARYETVLSNYSALAGRYNDAKETLKEYFQNQLEQLEQDENWVSSDEVIDYIKQEEAISESQAETEEQSSENDETKIDVKLQEVMDEIKNN